VPENTTDLKHELVGQLWKEHIAASALPVPKVLSSKSKSDMWQRYVPAADAQSGTGGKANCGECRGEWALFVDFCVAAYLAERAFKSTFGPYSICAILKSNISC
jgi:hypothetical protein